MAKKAPPKAAAKKPAAKAAPKAAPKAARLSWLDKATKAPMIDEYARQLKTFMQTMADGVVDKNELKAQEDRLVALMEEVEPKLNDALHEKVTRLLCELTAYDIMRIIHEIQNARPKTTFQG